MSARVMLEPVADTGVQRLWLDRADKANALDAQMVEALADAFAQVAAQPPRVLVIEGRGRNFCAGFDFTGFESLAEGELLLRFVLIEQMLAALRELPCVTVACVRGGAFGAGADLAAACTFRLGLADARFRFPGLRFGLALGTRSLTALIGQQAAREILLSGAVVDAERALAVGLLSERLPGEDFAAAIESISGRFGRLDASSVGLALRNTSPRSADADLADLVRSVIRPGIKARIAAYRAGG